jgi:hypothetical protein
MGRPDGSPALGTKAARPINGPLGNTPPPTIGCASCSISPLASTYISCNRSPSLAQNPSPHHSLRSPPHIPLCSHPITLCSRLASPHAIGRPASGAHQDRSWGPAIVGHHESPHAGASRSGARGPAAAPSPQQSSSVLCYLLTSPPTLVLNLIPNPRSRCLLCSS